MIKKLFAVAALAISLSAQAGEKEIRQVFQTNYPNAKVEAVSKTPYAGLYEVVVDGQVLYSDEQASYFFMGDVVDTKTRRSVTEPRRRQVSAIDFSKLPLDLAIKQVRGNGKRKIAQFTDPNCGFCKRLEKEFAKMDNVTIYSFLVAFQPGSDEMTKNIMCAKSPLKAWNDLMLNNTAPAKADCTTQLDKVAALAAKHRVSGTPAMVFSDGVVNPGYLPAEEIEKRLADIDKK